jgi:hypothetical protein
MKANKENTITDILAELKIGISYSKCLDVIGRKWTLSESTFKRYWKEANSRHERSQLEQQKVINEQSIANTIELQNKHNITRDSLVTELNEVKELAKIPDQFGKINATAVIKAIEVQAKLLGLNEAEKSNITILKGADDLFIEE